MKRSFFILLLVSIATICGVSTLTAQSVGGGSSTATSKQSKKSFRNYRRAQSRALDAISIANMVRDKNFTFFPDQLQFTDNYNYQNIPLGSSYSVYISPTIFRVYLPIYGNSVRTGQPSVWRSLDFFTENFTYDIEQNTRSGGWRVTIKAMDTWSFNTFTFVFEINNHSYCQMSISTPFVGPSIFSGNIASN